MSVSAATVTYLKPTIGTDPAGFFVQASPTGPAIFLTIDPATLNPVPAVGDRVAFNATLFSIDGGLSLITGLTNWQRLGTGSVSGFTQDLSTTTPIASAIDGYESELISIRGILDGGSSSAGSPYIGFPLSTAANLADNMRFRAPQALVDSLELERGCDITTGPTPMWRFNAQAQPSAWVAGDVVINSCPGPTVASASPVTSTSVTVNFSRSISAASVQANGSQFTFNNGATASAATVSGKSVTVTTSALTAGTSHTVTVANTVTDTRNTALGTPAAATFFSLSPNVCSSTNQVVISQVYGGGGNSGAVFTNDFIELHNRSGSPVDITNFVLYFQSANTTSAWNKFIIAPVAPATTVVIPAGGFFLVQAAAGTTASAALPTPDAVSTFAIGATSFKVALTNATVTTLTGACPTTAGILDIVGAGTATTPANHCFEGPAAVAAPANATAVIRKATTGLETACIDSNNSVNDFVVATPTPRNTASTAVICAVCSAL